MALGLGLELGLSFVCPVCERKTLPACKERGICDPNEPDYRYCSFCDQDVPSEIRRKKSYQRRWDADNARSIYAFMVLCESRLREVDPSWFSLEPAESESPKS